MTKRQFLLGSFVLVAVLLVVGTIGFFSIKKAEINRKADVRQQEIQRQADRDIQLQKQNEKTKRTENRWDAIKRLPFLKGKKSE